MRRWPLLFALSILLTVVAYRVLGQQRFDRLATNGEIKQTREEAAARMPFHFTKDYFPGTLDAAGKPLIGTEMMNFAVHGGKLYAGLGNRNLPEDAPVKVGAQIIVKDSEGSPWRVELQFRETAPGATGLPVLFRPELVRSNHRWRLGGFGAFNGAGTCVDSPRMPNCERTT